MQPNRKQKVTTAGMARWLGMSTGGLHNILRRTKDMSSKTLRRVSVQTEISADDWLFLAPEKLRARLIKEYKRYLAEQEW